MERLPSARCGLSGAPDLSERGAGAEQEYRRRVGALTVLHVCGWSFCRYAVSEVGERRLVVVFEQRFGSSKCGVR